MDSVPFDFCERVTATWKCCETMEFHCDCVMPVFSDRTWAFRKLIKVDFGLTSTADGVWKYCFYLAPVREMMTMRELLAHPDIKNMWIDYISVYDPDLENDMKQAVSDVGTEKLLNLVSFLTNEPHIEFYDEIASGFRSPEGSLLLNWIEKRWFSFISFSSSQPNYSQVIRKQSSRRKPTDFYVVTINNAELFAEQLKSGKMTILTALDCLFPHDVMEGIIHSFLCATSKNKVKIETNFELSIMRRLKQLEKIRWCKRDASGNFIFQNPFHQLVLTQTCIFMWKCISV